MTKEEDLFVCKCPKDDKFKKDGETCLQKTWSHKRTQSFEKLSARWGRSRVNEVVTQEFGGEKTWTLEVVFQKNLHVSHEEQEFVD